MLEKSNMKEFNQKYKISDGNTLAINSNEDKNDKDDDEEEEDDKHDPEVLKAFEAQMDKNEAAWFEPKKLDVGNVMK